MRWRTGIKTGSSENQIIELNINNTFSQIPVEY